MKGKKMNFSVEVLNLIKNAKNVAIVTHVRPDADCLGSASALKGALLQLGKTADIYYRAMLAKAKLKMLTGEMVDRKRAGNYAFNLGRALRDLFMSFPVRYGALIAAELGTDEHQTSAVLDEYIRKMLTESQDILSKELWDKFPQKTEFRWNILKINEIYLIKNVSHLDF